jgi:hypothetical protein
MVKPDNPQKNYRPGTMLGNLKAWEKDMQDRQTGKLPPYEDESGHGGAFGETRPGTRGRVDAPVKPRK